VISGYGGNKAPLEKMELLLGNLFALKMNSELETVTFIMKKKIAKLVKIQLQTLNIMGS